MSNALKVSVLATVGIASTLYLQLPTAKPLPEDDEDEEEMTTFRPAATASSSGQPFLGPDGQPVDPSQFTIPDGQIPDGFNATPLQQGSPSVDYDGIPQNLVPKGDTYLSQTSLQGFRGDLKPGFVANPGSGLKMGDKVLLSANGKSVIATVYDVGPERNTSKNIAEASPAALEALGYGIRGSNGGYVNSVTGSSAITVHKLTPK